MKLSVDQVLDLIGHLGYGQVVYCMCLGMLQTFLAFHMILTTFVGLEPEFFCYAKDGSSKNMPFENQCIENQVKKCRISYQTEFTSFAVEWNLICDEKYKVASAQSIWMGGVMTGALLLGGVADSIGRIKTLMVSLLVTIAFEGFSSLAPTYNIYIFLRFIGGISCSLVIIVSFVLSQELVGSSRRSMCGISVSMFFSAGIALLSLIASLVDNWRTLSMITSATGILFVLLPCYIPESPRWLLSQGRSHEAKQVLELIAVLNGTQNELPSHWEASLGSSKETCEKKTHGIWDLTKTPYLFCITAIQIFSWFVNSATYYGLTMASSSLGGNVYISTCLNGLIEIPACLLCCGVIDRLGRRITLCSFMLFGGSACMMIQLVPQQYSFFSNFLALCGKLSIAASFAVCYVHSAEIFPTSVRNSAMGIVSVAARIGGILAPFILMIGDTVPRFQFTILGILVTISGLLNLRLPETLGQPLPETVADILDLRHITTLDCNKSSKEDKELGVARNCDQLKLQAYGKRKDEQPLIQD